MLRLRIRARLPIRRRSRCGPLQMRFAVTILVFCVAGLLALGMVMLYSSGMAQVGARYLLMQLLWGALGIGVCIATTLVDYRLHKKFWWLILGAAIAMLTLVLI